MGLREVRNGGWCRSGLWPLRWRRASTPCRTARPSSSVPPTPPHPLTSPTPAGEAAIQPEDGADGEGGHAPCLTSTRPPLRSVILPLNCLCWMYSVVACCCCHVQEQEKGRFRQLLSNKIERFIYLTVGWCLDQIQNLMFRNTFPMSYCHYY